MNEVGDCSVPEELLNEAIIISLERAHNSSASAGYEECSTSAVHDGSAPAQSLKMIETNIV